MSAKNIFVVDDETEFSELVADILSEDYSVYPFSSGGAALDKISQINPDVVLLDVGLPDMNGFDLCREIKQKDTDNSIATLFISGHDTLEERVEGYRAGAEDYIVKPVSLDELKLKVNAICKVLDDRKSLVSQEAFSRDMAFNAMTEASQYGSVLQFFKRAAVCKSALEIADEVINICNEFCLNCTVQIRQTDEIIGRKRGGEECTQIENQLFELLCMRGRIYTFNRRYMFNDRHVSILIPNMPTDDEVILGRLNDLLATIVEAAESAVTGLNRTESLHTLMDSTESALESIKNSYTENKSKTISIMDNMIRKMDYALGGLGLTEDQENFFINLAENTLDELIELHGDAYQIEHKLVDVLTEISARNV